MAPSDIGLESNKIVLGRHSGRHGLKTRLAELGFVLTKEELNHVYDRFLQVADKKKEVYEEDLLALVSDETEKTENKYQLVYFHILSGNQTAPTAAIKLRYEDKIIQEAAVGDGPIDAAYKAIDKLTGSDVKLAEYNLRGVTSGKDALGEVVVRLGKNGKKYLGRGASTDVIEASIRAYLSAVNRIHAEK
jgi:2-isopropylmalate synthase